MQSKAQCMFSQKQLHSLDTRGLAICQLERRTCSSNAFHWFFLTWLEKWHQKKWMKCPSLDVIIRLLHFAKFSTSEYTKVKCVIVTWSARVTWSVRNIKCIVFQRRNWLTIHHLEKIAKTHWCVHHTPHFCLPQLFAVLFLILLFFIYLFWFSRTFWDNCLSWKKMH